MNEISDVLRKAIIDLIGPIQVSGVSVPVFDEAVNPNVTIPELDGAKVYVLIKDQQENETTSDKCGVRQNALITFDCVAKFPVNVGSKRTVEKISREIQLKVKLPVTLPGWQVVEVTKVNSNALIEQGLNSTAYRKLITYSFDVFEVST